MNQNGFLMQEALGQIDPALVEEAGTQAGKHRRSVPVRVLTVAACLAAILVVGAVAAELAGFQISGILTGAELPWIRMPDGDIEDYSGYIVSGIENFNWDNISEELRDAAATASAASEDQVYLYSALFGSQVELEELLGFELPKNSVLDAGRESTAGYTVTGEDGTKETVLTFARLDVDGKEETGPIAMMIHTNYTVSDPNHVPHEVGHSPGEQWNRPDDYPYRPCPGEVHVRLVIHAASAATIMYTYQDQILTQETYVTPGGREAVIVQAFSEEYQDTDYIAHFTLGELTMEISASGGSCVDLKGILLSILDAYDIPAA